MQKRRSSAVVCAFALVGLALPAASQDAPPAEAPAPGYGMKLKDDALELLKRAAPPDVPPPPDVAAPPEDASRSASGLAWKVLEPGHGASPGPLDWVGVLYTGWTTAGTVVDTTEPSDIPKEFGLFRALPGFQEGLQLMKVGETRRLWIPEELAYAGARGKPAGMLVFDIKLLDFEPGPTPPEDAAAVPKAARRNESGLAWRVLREGNGDKPGPNASVAARFSVWTTAGKLVDSTEGGHAAATFKLELAIPAFREAFADMKVGERRRLWAPAELARVDPSEVVDPMTVFDLELLSFQRAPEPPASLAPPEDAARSLTGLVSKVLRPGTGDRQPKIGDVVEVAFAGWTDKGEPIDSSYEHGRPAVIRLDQRLPLGWNEALQAMKVGERRLVWMPQDLARTAAQVPVEGTQLLDLELLAIRDAPGAAGASH